MISLHKQSVFQTLLEKSNAGHTQFMMDQRRAGVFEKSPGINSFSALSLPASAAMLTR